MECNELNYSGNVQKVSSFDLGNKKLWSFTLKGQKGFFRTGEKHPNVEQDQSVTFEGNPDPKGNVNVIQTTIKLSTEQQASGVSGGVVGAGNKSVYAGNSYPTKAERDATQKRIEIQSCRNSALELVKILMDKGEIKIPAKTDKVEFIEALVKHYTEQFIAENAGSSEPKSQPTADDGSHSESGGYN